MDVRQQRACTMAWSIDKRPPYAVGDVAVARGQVWATSSEVVLRFDGRGWRAVAPPVASSIEDVAAEGNAVWLLGPRSVFRWTGRAWRRVEVEGLPMPRRGVALAAIDTSGEGVWVGGRYANSGGLGFGWVTARLSGGRWTTNARDSGYSYLSAVDAVDAGYAWAVGGRGAQIADSQAVLLRWDGSGWKDLGGRRSSVLGLFDVLALSRKEAWAVGVVNIDDYGTDEPPAILRWNGIAWMRSSAPRRATPPALYSLAAFNSRDVWAGGHAAGRPVLMHWDGARWSYSKTPPVLGAIRDLAAAPDGTLWAVGENFIAHARCR